MIYEFHKYCIKSVISIYTVVREIFVFGNFRGKHFRVKIFSWSGGYHENLYTLRNYVEK